MKWNYIQCSLKNTEVEKRGSQKWKPRARAMNRKQL